MDDKLPGGAAGADVLASAIIAEAEAEAVKTRETAKAEADRIIRDAEAEAAERHSSASREEMDRVHRETATELALAGFEARRQVLNAREELIEDVFNDLWTALDTLKKSDSYPRMLAVLAREALSALDGDEFIVEVAPGDESVARRALVDGRAEQLEIHADPAIRGGCIVWQRDRRAYYDNSFAAIVERDKPHLRPLVAEWLWGAGQQWQKS